MKKDDHQESVVITSNFSELEIDAQHQSAKDALPEQRLVSLLIYTRDGIKVVSLEEGRSLIIGRLPPADIIVRDASLSRQHARIMLKQGEVWIEDLQSTNSTWVGGEKIDRCKVDVDDELAFGGVTASVSALGDPRASHLGFESHDRFRSHLDREMTRALSRGSAVSLIRSSTSESYVPLSRRVASRV